MTGFYWIDGGCRAGGHAYGSISDGTHLETFELPEARTNNEAEYQTLLRLLRRLKPEDGCEIFTDSRLLVGQLVWGWRIRAENLLPLQREAWNLLQNLPAVTLTWVRRDEIERRLGH